MVVFSGEAISNVNTYYTMIEFSELAFYTSLNVVF